VFPVDDAYIAIHNAQVLTGAPEHCFRNTPALIGSTSIVHTLLLSTFMLVLSPLWAALFCQYVAILLYALAVVRLARVYSLSTVHLSLLLFVALLPGTPFYHLFNGLETCLALAAMVFALSLAVEGSVSRLLPVCCGVLPLIRPEFAALCILPMIWLAWQRWSRRRDSGWLRSVGGDIGICFAAALPFVLLLRWNTGSFVPNTIGAKEFYFAEATLPHLIKRLWMEQSIREFAFAVGPAVAALMFLATTRLRIFALCFVPTFLAAYYIRFPGALAHYDHRYMYVLFPLMLLGVCQGEFSNRKSFRWVATGLLVLTAVQHVATLRSSWSEYVKQCQFTRHQLTDLANFCNRSFSPDTRLLIHDAGYISFATQFELVDLVGLKTPAAVAYNRAITYPTSGYYRSVAISRLALDTHPQYLVVLNAWDRIFRISDGLRQNGWTLDRVWGDPTEIETFSPFDSAYQKHYIVFRLSRPPTAAEHSPHPQMK
jgi:hypothetical protein